jgi:hypothetical protein
VEGVMAFDDLALPQNEELVVGWAATVSDGAVTIELERGGDEGRGNNPSIAGIEVIEQL